ncbi:MAG TPA: hypothetical protein VIF82_11430 [Burkholderiaceae bacterium]|jgi:hypothetical protein
MQLRLKKIIAVGIALMIALKLFTFGIHFPLTDRARGDAFQYIFIANHFSDYPSDILGYAGDRTVGFPLFEYLIRQFLGLFTSINVAMSEAHFVLWIQIICTTMLIIHLVTAWYFSAWARTVNLVKSDNGVLLLFVFLASYPAMIGLTTTPLTDTLATDLILCATILLDSSLKTNKKYRALLFSVTAGLIFGFSILVRPGSIIALAVAFAIIVLITFFIGSRKTNLIFASILACVAILMPFVHNCTGKFSTVCLQNPHTFESTLSAQVGLKGTRTLWSKVPVNKDPEGIPTLPDDTMVKNYYRRCHLTAIVGLQESSLTGCLLSRPLALPAYVVKKWMGLFDHFRFTPYLDLKTPLWILWLSRAYDVLAWIGLALIFITPFKATRRLSGFSSDGFSISNITPVLLFAYSLIMLAQHTLLHVEERYGFPLIPVCAVALIAYCEAVARQKQSIDWRKTIPLGLYCLFVAALFIIQTIIWDHTVFY